MQRWRLNTCGASPLTGLMPRPPSLTQIDNCFKLLDMPPLSDLHPLTLHSDIIALLLTDANILVNAIFLRGLPEAMRMSLAVKADLTLFELAHAAPLHCRLRSSSSNSCQHSSHQRLFAAASFKKISGQYI